MHFISILSRHEAALTLANTGRLRLCSLQLERIPLALFLIEWGAFAVGTVGTLLWSLGKNQLLVSVLWMFSAILWVVFAFYNGHYGLTARDLLGVILYAVGIRTYWLRKKAAGKSTD